MTTYKWHEGTWPVHDKKIKQVYAYVLDQSGKVLVQDDSDTYNLPGGKPEISDIDEIDTLKRECLEESQVLMKDEVYLGFVEVNDEDGALPYAQLRYLAFVDELRPVSRDLATGKIYGRKFVPLNAVDSLLRWGAHGE